MVGLEHWEFSMHRCSLILAGALAVLVAAHSLGQSTIQVSVTPSGGPADGESANAAISADGRYVAFESNASNLVSGDTNFARDIFLRDCQAGATIRVSVGTFGEQATGSCSQPCITADGRYVAFWSSAASLGALSGGSIILRDTLLGQTRVASGSVSNVPPNLVAAMSDDALRVAFTVGGGTTEVCVCNAMDGSVVAVLGAGGWDTRSPSLSANGRFVAFESNSATLVPNDTNDRKDVFVYDTVASACSRVSVDSAGVQGGGESVSASISADGRYVAFASNSSTLVPGDDNYSWDLFVHDRATGMTRMASTDATGGQPYNLTYYASLELSADGRMVLWSDGNGGLIHLHDLVSGQTSLASVNSSGGAALGACNVGRVSGNGRFITFQSNAPNLAPPTPSTSQVFLHDAGQSPGPGVGLPFCFGDGTGSPCPCDPWQAGALGYGCANSSGNGAMLSATGSRSISADTLQLHVAGLPVTSSVLFFQGTNWVLGGLGAFNGDGLLCVNGPAGSLIRLGARPSSGGSIDFGVGIGTDPAISVAGQLPAIGATRYYQAWYRDNTVFCTTVPANFSNGLAIVWTQ